VTRAAAYSAWKKQHQIHDHWGISSREHIEAELRLTAQQIFRRSGTAKNAPTYSAAEKIDQAIAELEQYENSLRLALNATSPSRITCKKCGTSVSETVAYLNSARCEACAANPTHPNHQRSV
jgi:hypothetical protein